MNDERFLKDWLRDTTDSTRDPNVAADKVVSQISATPQRRRWLLWPPARHPKPNEPNGRTRFMLNPSSAVVAGVLAFAVGTALLIAQPLVQVDDTPAAEGGADHAPPSEVTITGFGGSCGGGTFEEVGIKTIERGSECAPTLEADDERLSGTVTYASNKDVYKDDSRLAIEAYAISIENDEGAWRSRPIYRLEYPGAAASESDVYVLDGEDAYEGLTAVLTQDGFYAFHGFIIEGELPPVPDNGQPAR